MKRGQLFEFIQGQKMCIFIVVDVFNVPGGREYAITYDVWDDGICLLMKCTKFDTWKLISDVA